MRIDVLGCPFDAVTFHETVAAIEAAVEAGARLRIVPGNVDTVMKARSSADYRKLMDDASLVIADGVPIVWAASLLGVPLKGRVSGTDLVWHTAGISARLQAPVALIGAGPGVADRAAARMRAAHPGALLHVIPTPETLTPDNSSDLASRVRDIGARIVLVALGAPRQDRWLAEHLVATSANVGIGIGSAFDILSGDKPRAPSWMADNGLEWLHRLRQEPARLWRRYLIEDSPFFLALAHELAARRLRGAGGRP